MEGKKKILWVHNFPNLPGAGGVWMYNQYDFLKNEVDLYYVNNARNPIIFLRHMFKLISLSKKYDLAHAQYGSATGFLTSLMSCKRILSLKGSDWYTSPSSSVFHKVRIFLGGLLTSFSIKRFQHIIVMSNKMKEQVLAKYPSLNISVIVDPIDLEKFKPLDLKNKGELKKVLFASVNLNNPIKRFHLAKKSFEELQKKMSNVEFITMNKIAHSEVNSFINNVDVLIITSVYEGWPNVVKEVLACNIPFVSTKISDLEELAAKTQTCFACNDAPEELGEALFKALNAEQENLRPLVADFNMPQSLVAIKKIYAMYL